MVYVTQLASRIRTEPVWHIPLLCVQLKPADDGQRNCPKHVEFYSKNKFDKLVHLVGFIIRIYHAARSPERQIAHAQEAKLIQGGSNMTGTDFFCNHNWQTLTCTGHSSTYSPNTSRREGGGCGFTFSRSHSCCAVRLVYTQISPGHIWTTSYINIRT